MCHLAELHGSVWNIRFPLTLFGAARSPSIGRNGVFKAISTSCSLVLGLCKVVQTCKTQNQCRQTTANVSANTREPVTVLCRIGAKIGIGIERLFQESALEALELEKRMEKKQSD